MIVNCLLLLTFCLSQKNHYFPHDVLVEILHRLPPKSLLKCTFVCKSWRSIITHPSFISDHLRTPIYANNRFLLLQLSNKTYRLPLHYSLRHDDEHLTEFSTLHLPRGFELEFQVVGIRNGLVCITNSKECYTLFVCNPCIRRYVRLRKPHHYLSLYKACVGFGFDSVTNDYKIVRIACTLDRRKYGLCAPGVEVYSLATGVWKNITAVAPVCSLCFVGEDASHGFVDGVVHWGAQRRVDDHWYNFVLSFDFRDEVFGEVMLPESLASVFSDMDMVTVIGGGESLTVYHVSAGLTCSCNIWVMKEYGVVESWNKLFTFNLRRFSLEALSLGITLTGVMGPPAPIFFRNSREVLLLVSMNHLGKGRLYSLDAEKNRFTDLKIGGEEHTWYMYSSYYIESLVLLNKASGLVSY